mgnify:CR=1 FL=1
MSLRLQARQQISFDEQVFAALIPQCLFVGLAQVLVAFDEQVLNDVVLVLQKVNERLSDAVVKQVVRKVEIE